MKRPIMIFTITMMLIFVNTLGVCAANNGSKNKISLKILSPDKVKDYPGREATIKVQVTNNTNQDINDVLVYITMADIKKNMTVNLEDFNATKPAVIDTLKPNESRDIELPIRFVYTSNYYLYITATSKEYKEIVSSTAIPIEILGNTKINKSMVLSVVIFEPLVLLAGILGTYVKTKNKYRVN